MIYNNYLDKLRELSLNTDLKIFKKKNNNWILRDTRVIMNECNKLKRKIDFNKNLNHSNINYSKTLSDIDTIENIINIVNNEQYIEVYSND